MWSGLIANHLVENSILCCGGWRSPPIKEVQGGTSFFREKIFIREGVITWQEVQQ
jgi:hypothetical protein